MEDEFYTRNLLITRGSLQTAIMLFAICVIKV